MSASLHALGHPEVDERHTAVGHQPVVAWVGVPGEVPVAVERAEEEAEDDLAEAVAGGAVELLDLLEAHAVDPLGDQHVLACESSVTTFGMKMNGCPRQVRAKARCCWASCS